MSAYTFRAAGSWSASGSPGGPSGVVAGDLLLMYASARLSSETINAAPSGWTLLFDTSTTDHEQLAIFGRIATADASDTVSAHDFWSGTSYNAAQIAAFYGDVFSGGLGSIVAHSVAQGSTSSTANLPTAALTISTADTLVIGAGIKQKTLTSNGASFTDPAWMTSRIGFVSSNGTASHCVWGYVQQSTAANISADTWTQSVAESLNYASLVISLQTASASAPGWTANPSMSSQTALVYTVGFTPNASATIYGVAVAAGDTAPSVAQVKAGQNNAGTTAKAANSKAVTGVDTLTLTPTDVPVAATYDLYFVLSNAGGDSSRQALAGEALDAPAFTVPATVTSQTSTVYTLGFTPDAACTIYGVAVVAGATAPSVAQIKAGQNGSGAAAKANNSKAVTGADSFTLTPSDSPAFPRYDLYCVLSGNTGDSARRTLASEYLDAPTGKNFATLTSLDATSPFYGTGAAIADTVVIDTTTDPDAYVVTCAVDGTVSYVAGGDDSRQLVDADVYDYSAGAYLGAGVLVFNNLAPDPGDVAFVAPLLYRKDVAISTLPLTDLAPDPELDTVVVTALDSLPAGLSITTSELVGTPTAYGETDTQIEWEDQYGATYVETVTIQVGDLVPDVIGDAQATAVSAIEAVASLTTSVTTESSGSVASGNVISTDPVAGTLVASDAVIAVVVSSGSSLTITTTTLASGTRDVAYTATLTANGAVTSWSLSAGNLPTGLSLSSAGVISGTPTVAGAYAFTVGATNGAASDTQALTLTIAGVAPTITTTELTRAIEGEAYSAQLAATGDATITYAVTTGLLPAGLSLSSSGAITGTPTELGGNAFTVTATNSEGSDTQDLGLSVVAASLGYVLTLKPLRNRINLRRRRDA